MNWRIGIPSEALRGGASARGPRREGLGGAEGFGLSSEASAQALGESENPSRPRGCPLALIFARLKQYFRFLLRVPLLVVSDSTLQDIVMRPTHLFVIMVDEHFSTTGAPPSQPTLVTKIRFANPFLYFWVLLTALDDFFSTITLYH